ncbi:GNAT family N-acetyltransferase [Pseudoalteromonas piscicida]|uniref:GNAT family N-acetyltransferase n=1 Tax=Pseudoalteromonas piscicida TaxID=43662 RepID=UPI000E35939B|nr:GNAT family N-acetyltransferase [Pseudoalteromonas piscicida]AXR00095.1 GNAT family N-acetyltransferase [Pseudoalteromonas piscicida]
MIHTARAKLVALTSEYAEKLVTYHLENRDYFAPWEPARPESYYSIDYWLAHTEQAEHAAQSDTAYHFIALLPEWPLVVGLCSFTQVARGPFQACYLGYSIASQFAGQGYMTEILEAAISHVFDERNMHRIMANYMPSNVASARVLQKLGFEQEGYAKQYLHIAGKWEDHILTAKLRAE